MTFSPALAYTPNKVTPYYHSVLWGINPPQKHHPVNLQTDQAPFLGNPPIYIGFS